MEFLSLEINNEKVYAGFWKRFCAAIIDMPAFIPFPAIYHFVEGLFLVAAMTSKG
jgi:hypothetical protein